MVLAGSFDKFPRLKVIIGHMGEMLPTMLARCDDFIRQKDTGLPRSVSQTILDHVYITTSGFFTVPPFLAALLTFGADRILFSVDYPFSNNVVASNFLNSLPIAPDDREKIAHGNADRLLKLELIALGPGDQRLPFERTHDDVRHRFDAVTARARFR